MSRWEELSSGQLGELDSKAEAYFINYQKFHQCGGLTADIVFSAHDRATVTKLEGVGDSATWTGHYLTALACRYAVLRSPDILNDIRAVLHALEVLTHVTGTEGYIARFAGPRDDLPYAAYYRTYGAGPDKRRPGFGTCAYAGTGKYTNLVWLGNSSVDTYDGVNLGLATAFRLVREPKIRKRLQTLIESITDRLIRDGWKIDDRQGHSISATLSMMGAVLCLAAAANPAKYQAMFRQRATWLEAPQPIDETEHYYLNNLQFITHYVMATLEIDSDRKEQYLNRIQFLWEKSSHHLNPWFAALYISATGNISNVVARATVQGVLFEFPPPPRWARTTDNTKRQDIEVMQSNGQARSTFALPIRQRPVSDFMWQRTPFALSGSSTVPLEYPGIDVFLPYWMARECGAVGPPLRAP